MRKIYKKVDNQPWIVEAFSLKEMLHENWEIINVVVSNGLISIDDLLYRKVQLENLIVESQNTIKEIDEDIEEIKKL